MSPMWWASSMPESAKMIKVLAEYFWQNTGGQNLEVGRGDLLSLCVIMNYIGSSLLWRREESSPNQWPCTKLQKPCCPDPVSGPVTVNGSSTWFGTTFEPGSDRRSQRHCETGWTWHVASVMVPALEAGVRLGLTPGEFRTVVPVK